MNEHMSVMECNMVDVIDREFEFYESFSFAKYNEFYEFFFG